MRDPMATTRLGLATDATKDTATILYVGVLAKLLALVLIFLRTNGGGGGYLPLEPVGFLEAVFAVTIMMTATEFAVRAFARLVRCLRGVISALQNGGAENRAGKGARQVPGRRRAVRNPSRSRHSMAAPRQAEATLTLAREREPRALHRWATDDRCLNGGTSASSTNDEDGWLVVDAGASVSSSGAEWHFRLSARL